MARTNLLVNNKISIKFLDLSLHNKLPPNPQKPFTLIYFKSCPNSEFSRKLLRKIARNRKNNKIHRQI